MTIPVFVFHEGRCGRTVLMSLLHDPPHTIALNEVLTPGTWLPYQMHIKWLQLRDDAADDLDLCAFLHDLLANITESFAFIEFKFYQLPKNKSIASNVHMLLSTFLDSVAIFMTRENSLRRIVSHLRCVENKITHKTALDASFPSHQARYSAAINSLKEAVYFIRMDAFSSLSALAFLFVVFQ